MPAFSVLYPGSATKRMIEARDRRAARRLAAKSFEIKALNAREVYVLGEQGVVLEEE